MVGNTWLMYLEGYNFYVAIGEGFIALAGVAVGGMQSVMVLTLMALPVLSFLWSRRQ